MFHKIPQILKGFAKKNKGNLATEELITESFQHEINGDGTISIGRAVPIEQELAANVVEACSKIACLHKPSHEKHDDPAKKDQNVVDRLLKGEISENEQVGMRESQRRSITKWFSKSRSDSGSFDARELEERMDENARRAESDIAPLPVVEDVFIAFSRAEDDPFSERSISISGVFQIVHLQGDPDIDEDDGPIAIDVYKPDAVLSSLNRSSEGIDDQEEHAEAEAPRDIETIFAEMRQMLMDKEEPQEEIHAPEEASVLKTADREPLDAEPLTAMPEMPEADVQLPRGRRRKEKTRKAKPKSAKKKAMQAEPAASEPAKVQPQRQPNRADTICITLKEVQEASLLDSIHVNSLPVDSLFVDALTSEPLHIDAPDSAALHVISQSSALEFVCEPGHASAPVEKSDEVCVSSEDDYIAFDSDTYPGLRLVRSRSGNFAKPAEEEPAFPQKAESKRGKCKKARNQVSQSADYWEKSERLAHFGRRRTSLACSSIRTRSCALLP